MQNKKLMKFLHLKDEAIFVRNLQDVLDAEELLKKVGINIFSSDRSKTKFIENNTNIEDMFLIEDDDGWRIQTHYIGTGTSVEELRRKIDNTSTEIREYIKDVVELRTGLNFLQKKVEDLLNDINTSIKKYSLDI